MNNRMDEKSAKMLRTTYLKVRTWAKEHKKQRLIREQQQTKEDK